MFAQAIQFRCGFDLFYGITLKSGRIIFRVGIKLITMLYLLISELYN